MLKASTAVFIPAVQRSDEAQTDVNETSSEAGCSPSWRNARDEQQVLNDINATIHPCGSSEAWRSCSWHGLIRLATDCNKGAKKSAAAHVYVRILWYSLRKCCKAFRILGWCQIKEIATCQLDGGSPQNKNL